MLEPLSKRVNELGWHVQIHQTGDNIVKMEDILQKLPSQIVFDHMGRIPKDVGTAHPAYTVISKLIAKGRTWVKISGAYMDTKVGPPTYADSTKLAQALVKLAPAAHGVGLGLAASQPRRPTTSRTTPCSSTCSPNGRRTKRSATRILVDNPAAL